MGLLACSTRPTSRRSRSPARLRAKSTTPVRKIAARVRAEIRKVRRSPKRKSSAGGLDVLLVFDPFQGQHQPILEVVERVHRFGNGDVLGRPIAQRMLHLG